MSGDSDRRILQAHATARLNRTARFASYQSPVAFGRRELKRRINELCGTPLAMGRGMQLPPPSSELAVSDLNNLEILQHERRVSKLDDRLALLLGTMRETALALEKQIKLQDDKSSLNQVCPRGAAAMRERLRNIQSTISRLEKYDGVIRLPASDSAQSRRSTSE